MHDTEWSGFATSPRRLVHGFSTSELDRLLAPDDHSDHGCQYTSLAFGLRCKEAGVRPSMGSVGDAYDNAVCESFFGTLECELLDRHRFRTHAEARLAIFDFVEPLQSASKTFRSWLRIAHQP